MTATGGRGDYIDNGFSSPCFKERSHHPADPVCVSYPLPGDYKAPGSDIKAELEDPGLWGAGAIPPPVVMSQLPSASLSLPRDVGARSLFPHHSFPPPDPFSPLLA